MSPVDTNFMNNNVLFNERGLNTYILVLYLFFITIRLIVLAEVAGGCRVVDGCGRLRRVIITAFWK